MNTVPDMNEGPRPQFEDVAEVVRYQLSRRSLVGGGAAAALTGFLAACSGGGGSYSDKPANDKPVATKSIQIGKANIPVPRDQSVIVGQVEYTVFDSFNGMIPNGSPSGAGVELATEPMFFLSFATGKLTPWLATEYKYNDEPHRADHEVRSEGPLERRQAAGRERLQVHRDAAEGPAGPVRRRR